MIKTKKEFDEAVKACNIPLTILVYKEDSKNVARCLQMDILAYGRTPRTAVEKLNSLIITHLNYSAKHKLNAHLWNPSPKRFFEIVDGMEKMQKRKEELSERAVNFVNETARYFVSKHKWIFPPNESQRIFKAA